MSEGDDGGGVEEDRGKEEKPLTTKDTKDHRGGSDKHRDLERANL
jgi:hypothetical protein